MRRLLVEAMRAADRNGDAVAARALAELGGELRLRVQIQIALIRHGRRDADVAKLRFDRRAHCVRNLCDLARVFDVLLKRQHGAVVHDGGKARL